MKILLLEDDPIVQRVTQYLLNKLGHTLDVTNRGLQAIEMARNNPDYNFIFVDLGLPDISGFEVIKALRALYGPARKTNIVVLTGYVGKSEIIACEEAGADHIMYKPIELEAIKKFLAENYVNIEAK